MKMDLEVFYKTIHKVSAPSGAHCFEKTVNVLQKHGNNGKGSVCDEIIFLTNPYLFQPPCHVQITFELIILIFWGKNTSKYCYFAPLAISFLR